MGKRILLVEGKDDFHVVLHLCKQHDLPECFKIEPRKVTEIDDSPSGGGIENLFDTLTVLLRDGGLERLAIMVDADLKVQSRWAAIRNKVRPYVELPETPESGGTTVVFDNDFGPKRFSVWMMPNNASPGILEDFTAFLIPSDDRDLPRVDAFMDSIPEPDRKFKPASLPKARIHAWLAVQEQPGRPLGTAITCRYLSADHDTVELFVKWLRAALVD